MPARRLQMKRFSHSECSQSGSQSYLLEQALYADDLAVSSVMEQQPPVPEERVLQLAGLLRGGAWRNGDFCVARCLNHRRIGRRKRGEAYRCCGGGQDERRNDPHSLITLQASAATIYNKTGSSVSIRCNREQMDLHPRKSW
jgi:hypothetical protein